MKFEHIQFYNFQLLAGIDNQQKVWVSVTEICELLGLPNTWYYRREIRNEPLFTNQYQELTPITLGVSSKSGQRKTQKKFCLSLEFLPLWLARLRSDNPNLISFQLNCANVLAQHFKVDQASISNQLAQVNNDLSKLQLSYDNVIEQNYMSVQDFSKFNYRVTNLDSCQKLGFKLTRYCKANNIPIYKKPDAKWKQVNVYPFNLIAQAWSGKL